MTQDFPDEPWYNYDRNHNLKPVSKRQVSMKRSTRHKTDEKVTRDAVADLESDHDPDDDVDDDDDDGNEDYEEVPARPERRILRLPVRSARIKSAAQNDDVLENDAMRLPQRLTRSIARPPLNASRDIITESAPTPNIASRERDVHIAKRRCVQQHNMPTAQEEPATMSPPFKTLPYVDLTLMRIPEAPRKKSEQDLVRIAMSETVVPILKAWAENWMGSSEACMKSRADMTHTLGSTTRLNGRPYKLAVDVFSTLVDNAQEIDLATAHNNFIMAHFAEKLVRANMSLFDDFNDANWAANEPYKFALRLMLVVWEDISQNPDNSFFGILFSSDYYKTPLVVDGSMYSDVARPVGIPPTLAPSARITRHKARDSFAEN